MNSRKVLILFLSIMTVSIYFSLNANKHWFDERVKSFLNEIYDQVDYMTLDERKMVRWGPSYESCKIMKEYIQKDSTKNPLILLPPASYSFKFMQNLSIVEPVIFYYFTGLKTTTRESKDINKANYCITANSQNGQPLLISIKTSKDLDDALKEYQATPPKQ